MKLSPRLPFCGMSLWTFSMYMSFFFFSHKNRIIRQTLVTDIFIQQCAVSVSLWEARFLLAARVWQNSPQPSRQTPSHILKKQRPPRHQAWNSQRSPLLLFYNLSWAVLGLCGHAGFLSWWWLLGLRRAGSRLPGSGAQTQQLWHTGSAPLKHVGPSWPMD